MEKKCKYCAMMVPEEASICPYCRKRLKTSLLTKIVIGLFCLAAIAYCQKISHKYSTPSLNNYTSPSAAIEQQGFAGMTPAEHLREYKIYLRTGDMTKANMHMRALPPDSAEYKEAKKYYEMLKKERALADEKQKKFQIENQIQARKTFAKSYENNLLNQGIDAHVTTHGKDHTVLKVRFIGVSRPLAYKISNNADLLDQFRKIGFKKLNLTNGYDENWTIDL